MHLSPFFDPAASRERSAGGLAHRHAVGRGLVVVAIFVVLFALTMAPRLIHRASISKTLADFSAWDATNHVEARH